MSSPSVTVSEYNLILKNILESEILLKNIWITGEIINFKRASNGSQIYFSLSDGSAFMSCVIYTSSLSRLSFTPVNGLQIRAMGKPTLFQKRGSLMYQVTFMEEQGKGIQANQFDQLKSKLLKEGLFDAGHKKPIPPYPTHIGLITAEGSAAFHDFIRIKQEEAPHLTCSLLPATVQGTESAKSIIHALTLAETVDKLDVLVILRGGGSSEDLASFNEEALVRKVFDCTKPVIAAIGHEIDYTLVDFVSDHRSPTPTAAAHAISSPFIQLKRDIKNRIDQSSHELLRRLKELRFTVQDHVILANKLVEAHLSHTKDKIHTLIQRAESANPLSRLKQGYSFTTYQSSPTPISHITDLKSGDLIETRLLDGNVLSCVQETRPNSVK